MNPTECQALEAEISALKRMILNLLESSCIEKLSLESRLEKIEKKLAKMNAEVGFDNKWDCVVRVYLDVPVTVVLDEPHLKSWGNLEGKALMMATQELEQNPSLYEKKMSVTEKKIRREHCNRYCHQIDISCTYNPEYLGYCSKKHRMVYENEPCDCFDDAQKYSNEF